MTGPIKHHIDIGANVLTGIPLRGFLEQACFLRSLFCFSICLLFSLSSYFFIRCPLGKLQRCLHLAAGRRNYRSDIMFLLAVVVILLLVFIIWRDPAINEYVKGIFTLVLGRFLGYLDNIYSFEYGTNRSSKTKDATIENLSK